MALVFYVHYFLWYGALTSIFGYESVYARRYTNATTMQYGYLKMVLPFLTVIATPFMCSMADRYRSHRSYFTLSLIFTTISLCFYALLPLLKTDNFNETRPNHTLEADASLIAISAYSNNSSSSSLLLRPGGGSLMSKQPLKELLVGPWIYYCLNSVMFDLSLAINNCLADSFAVLQAEELGSSFGRIIVWGTFGWATTALALGVLNQWKGLPLLLPGLLFGVVLLTTDVFVVTFWKRGSDFKLDLIPADAASSLTGSSSPSHKDPNDYLPMNESARINLGSELDPIDGSRWLKTASPVELLRESRNTQLEKDSAYRSGSIETINSDVDNKDQLNKPVTSSPSSISSTSTIQTADLIPNQVLKLNTENPFEACNQLQQERQQQQQRSALKSSETVESTKRWLADKEKNYFTGAGGGSKIEAAESDESRDIQFTSFRMQLVLLGIILRQRKSLIRYLLLFMLSGFFMSMHWNYFFLYLQEIYYDEFAFISALSMVGQSILGELPFFILSRKVIDYFGRSYTLSISLISIGLRFLLYGYMLPNITMYSIIIADCLQGPNYGLFYVVMTEVGLEYSFCDEETIEKLAARGDIDRNNKRQVDAIRLSLRSTVQSMAYACYEGIGVGFGSLAGGWMKHNYGFKTLWTTTALASISVGLINAFVELALCSADKPANANNGPRDLVEAHRSGALKKLAPPLLIRSGALDPAAPDRRREEDRGNTSGRPLSWSR